MLLLCGAHLGGGLFALALGIGGSIKLSHFLRGVLLHMADGIDNAQDEDSGAHIERPLHAVGHNALRSHVGNTDGREQEGEDVAHQ